MLLMVPYLKGLAQLLLIPLAISGAFMGHMGSGFPMYNAMNADPPHWVIELSGLMTIGMALVLVPASQEVTSRANCRSPRAQSRYAADGIFHSIRKAYNMQANDMRGIG